MSNFTKRNKASAIDFSWFFSTNLKAVFRNLYKRKVYAALNIVGLSLGMTIAFLLWIYVDDQNSYDKHIANLDRIYRVNYDLNLGGERQIFCNVGRPVAGTLKSEFPEVKAATRIYGMGGLQNHEGLLLVEGKNVRSSQFFVADSSFFKVINLPFVSGNPDRALNDPNSIVISESLAIKLFGSTEVLGKFVYANDPASEALKITGVLKDGNQKTHLPIDALVSYTTFGDVDQWLGAHVYTYILLGEYNDITNLEYKMPAFYAKYTKDYFEQRGGTAALLFQPLSSIFLDQEYIWEPYPHGSKTNLTALSLLMFFLLLLACINYVNLATASSSERSREIGIRKTLGSSRSLLIAQFLTEPVLLALMSCVIVVMATFLLLPYFNFLTDLAFDASTILSIENLAFILILSVIIGLLAGLYPAFYLISLNAKNGIKDTSKGKKGELLRRALVMSQYCIASTLIIGVLFVAKQTIFIKNKDIGFDKENIVVLKIPDEITNQQAETLMESLRNESYIVSVTGTNNSLSNEPNASDPLFIAPDGTTFDTSMGRIEVDHDFIKTIKANIVAGRDFDRNVGRSEYESVLINESAVKKYNWGKFPTEMKHRSREKDENGNYSYWRIIGVVSDFNVGPAYQNVAPLMISLNHWKINNIYIRVVENKSMSAPNDIERLWQNFFPHGNFDFTFLDSELDALYRKEVKFLSLLKVICMVIIVIASLGVLGLVSFTLELKKKEIAIRKVNGAPVTSIIALLSRKFLILLTIANLLAIPIALLLINQWLNNFEQRIVLDFWPILLSVLVCLTFTVIALAYHVSRAIRSNPIQALRYE